MSGCFGAAILLVLWQDSGFNEYQRFKADCVKAVAKLSETAQSRGFAPDAQALRTMSERLLNPQKAVQGSRPGETTVGEDYYAFLKEAVHVLGEQAEKYKSVRAGLSPKLVDANKKLKEELDELDLRLEYFANLKHSVEGLRELNRLRANAKLPPAALDWEGSFGCFLHARYLRLNRGHPSTAGLEAHKEDPKLPGYTPEGAAAAKGIISFGGGGAGGIAGLWHTYLHRMPLVDPNLKTVAIGSDGEACVSKNGLRGGAKDLPEIVTVPGPDETDVPTAFYGELPNPLPKGVDRAGYCITARFTRGGGSGVRLTLWKGDTEIPCYELKGGDPCIAAKEVLEPKTTYTVKMTWLVGKNVKVHEWKFTTR